MNLAAAQSAAEAPGFLGPTTALVLAAAVVGYICVRAKVVPIVGFLLAGVLIGPSQLGLVASTEAVDSAAEVGVILLLFTIGIEFSLERLARVWRWIVIGGGTQVLLALGVGAGVVGALGGTLRESVFSGFLITLSSTAIVLKLLSDAGETASVRGRLALSVLIFQDLAVVAMVLVVPLLGDDTSGGVAPLLQALATAFAIVAVVLVVARRVMPRVLEKVAAACSPEVFLLSVVAICLGTAYLTALAGVSVSLGAFLAGLMVSESRHSSHALAEVLPLQIIFSAVFFVSVGMLLDLGFLMSHLPLVLGVTLSVLVLKVVTTTLALLPLPDVGWRQAAATGLLLGQIGEFSFVLVTVGDEAGLSPAGLGGQGSQTFVATTVLLMALTPLLAAAGPRLLTTSPRTAPPAARPEDVEEIAGDSQVVFLGWGADSLDLARDLSRRGLPVTMTTLNPGGAAEAEGLGIRVVRGDSLRSHVLSEAGVRDARLVVIAEDEPGQTESVARIVRGVTDAPIVVRTHGAVTADLAGAGIDHLIDAAATTRLHLHRTVLERLGETPPSPHAPAGPGDEVTWADPTRLVDVTWPSGTGCEHRGAVRPVLPGSSGCTGCLRDGTTWVHLRICLGCGHVGCCDSSPGRHARAHATETAHAIIASLEPGEAWAYCFVDDLTVQTQG